MASIKTNSRASVPTPRSGEDLVLQPLDPEEVLEKKRSQVHRDRRVRAIAAVVTSLAVALFAVFAAYRYRSAGFSAKSRGTTAALPKNDADRVAGVPLTLDVLSELVLPVPEPPKFSDGSKKTEGESPKTPPPPPAVAPRSPRLDDRVTERAAKVEKSPHRPAPWEKVDTPRRHSDAKPQGLADRQVPKSVPPPAKPEEAATAIQVREMKETIALMKTLIDRGAFVEAANNAYRFRERDLELATSHSSEYRELLKLQRAANEQVFKEKWPSYGTGDLEIAAIDHDLMDAYVRADMPTFAREHFLNAERGYDRAMSVARQRQRAEPKAANRDIQEIKENLGNLYACWAAYKLDNAILRKAEVAFWESEQLLDFAADRSVAKRQLTDGKAFIERTRGRLP